MWSVRRKKIQKEEKVQNDKLEEKIQAVHEDTLKKIDEATQSVREVNKLLDDPTYKIFLATGGDTRK